MCLSSTEWQEGAWVASAQLCCGYQCWLEQGVQRRRSVRMCIGLCVSGSVTGGVTLYVCVCVYTYAQMHRCTEAKNHLISGLIKSQGNIKAPFYCCCYQTEGLSSQLHRVKAGSQLCLGAYVQLITYKMQALFRGRCQPAVLCARATPPPWGLHGISSDAIKHVARSSSPEKAISLNRSQG